MLVDGIEVGSFEVSKEHISYANVLRWAHVDMRGETSCSRSERKRASEQAFIGK